MPRPAPEPSTQNLRGCGGWGEGGIHFFFNFLGDHNERARLQTIEINVSNVELLISISL